MIDFNKIDAAGDRFAAQAQAAREQLPILIGAVERTVHDLCRNPSIDGALARRAIRVEMTHAIDDAISHHIRKVGWQSPNDCYSPLTLNGVSYYLVPSLDPSPGWQIVNPWEPSDG